MNANATAAPHPSRASSAMHWLTRAVNPIGKAMAGHRWFKLYGLLVHRGRTSGREYRIAVVVRPFEDGFVIPMPFGERTQWAKNLVAAGGGQVVWNGRTYDVVSPELIDADAAGPSMPGIQRAAIGKLGMSTFMRLRIADPT
jgi:deazaflavin-dependent oxidoreductase (nitroreductase family)